jgi:predicted DNA-binding transcriptional regulator AlpA
MPNDETQAERFLRKAEICALTGWNRATIDRKVKAGKFPKSVVLDADSANPIPVWPLSVYNTWAPSRPQGAGRAPQLLPSIRARQAAARARREQRAQPSQPEASPRKIIRRPQ